MNRQRRRVLQAGAGSALGVTAGALTLSGCRRGAGAGDAGASASGVDVSRRDGAAPRWTAAWVGSAPERGHRLLVQQSTPGPSVQRRASVLVAGGGIAGLAAARAFARAGHDDVHLLELEDQAGGNSRGHAIAGMACPLGAHYLPLPGPQAREVSELLHELGLLRQHLGRTVADERHLCHSPQERLFVDGAWVEGLLPPAPPGSATLAQYRAFAAAVTRMQRELGFALPSHRAPWTTAHQALDAIPFARWLDGQGLSDARLRWYLDYCCRDDYGAPAAVVSAWAGLHYFASRHGFAPPNDGPASAAGDASASFLGDRSAAAEGERDPVFTWPEGNAWLARRLAQPLGERLLTGRTVLQVDEGRHGVQVLAWDGARGRVEAWQADTVVLAVPLFVAARLLRSVPAALAQIAPLQPHAPWLVANLHIDAPLLQRVGAAPAWDNVVFGQTDLGYVDAMHQSLVPQPGPTVLTAYHALDASERGALRDGSAPHWAQRVVQTLLPLHPDLPQRLRHIDLARHGHAMAVPTPGMRGHPALAALRAQRGRIRFAHADLAGYSVFEEAFTLGIQVAGVG